MARIFITGSADGLGQLAAKELISLGHKVVLHARNEERAKQANVKVAGAENVLIADLSTIKDTKTLAAKANALGTFDVVIHNAGVYSEKSFNAEGLPILFVVNSLAPYILTCLMHKPKRLIYLSSGMHLQGNPNFHKQHDGSQSNGGLITYSDTKLHDLILSMAVARIWTDVYSNAVDPGWVPTKMGGAGAPGSLEKGYETQIWLAVSDDANAKVSGQYFHHKRPSHFLPAAKDITVQEKFLTLCENITRVSFSNSKD